MSKPWVPLEYQLNAVRHLIERSHAGLFLKPGLRKTSIVLAAFDILKSKHLAKALLVIAPLRVCYSTWPGEIAKWNEFNHLSIGILHGPNKDDVLKEKHDVYVINYEGLKWLFFHALPRLKTWPFDVLIADESTKLKAINTQRFKIIKPELNKFARRYILTGSPTANGLMNLFGQCFVMDSGESLGKYITRFRAEFFYQTGFGGHEYKPKANAEEQIYERLAPRVFYAHEQDWVQLPPLIEKDIIVELPTEAKLQYLKMEKAFKLKFEAGEVTAVNAAVMSMKCRQIANGGIYLDSEPGIERAWQHIHEAKTEAVMDLIDELSGQPAIITYDFLHDLERLKNALGKDTPHIGSNGLSPSKLPELIRSWNRGEIPYILVHPQSMSHGVDGLQEAGRAVIWHSLTWSLENFEQLIRRLYRSGQQERVTVARIIAKGTIDEAIVQALDRKEKGQMGLLNALKEYWTNNSVH